MPKLHQRTRIVDKARNELAIKLCDIWERDKLTSLEVVAILAELTARHVRYPLRQERHPNNPNKKADEA